MTKDETIRRLILAAENMAREYNMQKLQDRYSDDNTIAYFANIAPRATSIISVRDEDNGDLTFCYRIVALYDTFFCEITFINDEKQQWIPTVTVFTVNGTDIKERRHKQAEVIYSQFEEELCLQFNKERIEELEREYAHTPP